MRIDDLCEDYMVRRLTKEDIPKILALLESNPMYYQYFPPKPTEASIRDDMEALPPGKTFEDKYYIGFFEGETLVVLMDMITHYPQEHEVWIGLFMMNRQDQGKGIGTEIIRNCCRKIRREGFRKVSLAFVEGNKQAECFWRKNGFEMPVRKHQDGEITMIVAERNLPSISIEKL